MKQLVSMVSGDSNMCTCTYKYISHVREGKMNRTKYNLLVEMHCLLFVQVNIVRV